MTGIYPRREAPPAPQMSCMGCLTALVFGLLATLFAYIFGMATLGVIGLWL